MPLNRVLHLTGAAMLAALDIKFVQWPRQAFGGVIAPRELGESCVVKVKLSV
jgi:hypothetical protein